MKRALLLWTALSSLLFLITAGLFVSSWSWRPGVAVEVSPGDTLSIDAFQGRVSFTRMATQDRSVGSCGTNQLSEDYTRASARSIGNRVEQGELDILAIREPPIYAFLLFDYAAQHAVYPDQSLASRTLVVPLWFVMLLTGAAPVVLLLKRHTAGLTRDQSMPNKATATVTA
ncbi:MAG: hypothetical protein ACPGYV_06240 [Phycisphaeraceae bacterium]